MLQVSNRVKETFQIGSTAIALLLAGVACGPSGESQENTSDPNQTANSKETPSLFQFISSAGEYAATTMYSHNKVILESMSLAGDQGTYSFKNKEGHQIEIKVQVSSIGYSIMIKGREVESESADFVTYQHAQVDFNSQGLPSQKSTWISNVYLSGENKGESKEHSHLTREPGKEDVSLPAHTLGFVRGLGFVVP